VFPNTNTFSFHGATYSSQWLTFVPVELEDRNRKPLDVLDASTQQVFQNIDKPPYTAVAQGVPFIDIGGRFVLSNAGYSPELLQGMTWDQIAQDLATSNAPTTKAIVGHANSLTAAICLST